MTRPDATLDQLRTLIDLANERHLHDAEQWLRKRVEAADRFEEYVRANAVAWAAECSNHPDGAR